MKTLQISVDEKKISDELSDLAMEKYRKLGLKMLEECFTRKNTRAWPVSEEDGEGTKFIKGIIDGLLLDDNAHAEVAKHVKAHWDKIFEEACIEAMKHKARALAFNAEGITIQRASL